MKRYLFGVILTLCMLTCLAPAQAAVVSGGTEYLWYVENGELICNEEGTPTGYRGDRLYLSGDQGNSYAEVPAFREATQRRWERYGQTARVLPMAGGGLSIDALGAEPLHLELSAGEIERLLDKAELTPVRVIAANEGMAVGIRGVWDTENGANWGDPYGGSWNYRHGERQLLWSEDGVTWNLGEEQPENHWEDSSGWWDGKNFYAFGGGLTSGDGIRWEKTEGEVPNRSFRHAADLGPYHFEVQGADDWTEGYNVYLTHRDRREYGVLLPHMGEAIRAKGLGVGDLEAWYGPEDTVILTAYQGDWGEAVASIAYPISSLDWCLENLNTCFMNIEPEATMEDIWLSRSSRFDHAYFHQEELVRLDWEEGGFTWAPVPDVPWGNQFTILPYSGREFFVVDGDDHLYRSADGLVWTLADTLRPVEMGDSIYEYIRYTILWTGKEYIAACPAGESRHGMMGHGGGGWYDGYSKVYFLNEEFQVVDSYDFGRLVEAVGFLDGTYYVQVSDSEGASDFEFDREAGASLYRSADGKTWEQTELIQAKEALRPLTMARPGVGAAGRRQVGAEGVADLDGYHFFLDHERRSQSWGWVPTIVVTDENGQGGVVPGAAKAIEENWLTAGVLSAAYDGKGGVKLTVEDIFTDGMEASVTCAVKELDRIIAAGENMLEGVRLDEDNTTHNDRIWLALHDVSGNEYGLWENKELVWSRVGGDEDYTYSGNTLDCTIGRLHITRDMPWSGRITLFPYNGRTFLIYDQSNGDFYLSEDGLDWTKAEADWIDDHREFLMGDRRDDRVGYSIVWTGERYIASSWLFGLNESKWEYERHPDNGKVLFLDEDFQLLSSHDFGTHVGAVGYYNGRYYANVSDDIHGYDSSVYCSADGENWEQVEEALLRGMETLQFCK